MAALTTIAAIGVGVAAVGTYMQYKESKKAAAAQQKSMELAQKRSDLQSARQRRMQYQQARIQRAAMTAQAGAYDVDLTGGSSFQGGRGSIGSQAGANVAFLNKQQDLAAQQTIFNINTVQAQTKASTWGAVAGLGTMAFQAGGGFTGGGGEGTQQVNTTAGSTANPWFSPYNFGGR